jgi:hypothetical protein
MKIERVRFTHQLLQNSVPSSIYISKQRYEQCKNYCKECHQKSNWQKYRLEYDIFFDVFYYLKDIFSVNKIDNSKYIRYDLSEDYPGKIDDIDFLNLAKEIGIVELYELCLYHAVWNHYWSWHYNQDHKSDSPSLMEDWDSMHQSKHIVAKTKLNYLIYLLLTDPERKKLMKEIRDFRFCPPMQIDGVSGYKYKKLKLGWQSRFE